MHKVTGLDHIGLAVRDSGKAREAFETLFGLKCTGEEVVESQKVKVVFLELGNTRLELIEPLGEGAVSKFLDKRGEGIHHICLKVDGIEEMLAEMKSKGAGLTSEGRARQEGRIHPPGERQRDAHGTCGVKFPAALVFQPDPGVDHVNPAQHTMEYGPADGMVHRERYYHGERGSHGYSR
jgi:methylmalonyl-CoA/ethylmalonyl-CoA epimerase